MIDYLIVGQGLAGTLLGYQLIRRNRSILIIDEYDENSSSNVAAGLFNPITGKRFVKTWLADVIFPYLHEFYPELEEFLDEKFFFKKEIYRPFKNIEEQNDWTSKSGDTAYTNFIKNIYQTSQFEDVHDPYGGVEIGNGGVIHLSKLISAGRKKFFDDKILINEKFDDQNLRILDSSIRYKNIQARRIVFCMGHQNARKGFFSWLPFRPVKGEILYLKPFHPFDKIFNKGCFVTPPVDGTCRCGSTYDWRDSSCSPTEKARKEIMEKFEKLFKIDAEILDQKAGIRPATLDRRPFIGIHPEYESVGIFNGLGTKGVSLAPYFSDQFVGYLENSSNLDEEVDIKRYYSLYYNSVRHR